MIERRFYRVNPLPIAAEIHDLDLTRLGDADLTRDLYADWMRYGVLAFRNTPVDNAQHLALSRSFGELEMHPLPQIRNPEEPLLMQLGGNKPDKAYVYDDKDLLVGRVPWHRDTAYTVDISKGSMLRVLERPEEGGDTLFSDTAAAYDALPDHWKQRIAGLHFKATLRLDFREMSRGVTWSSIRWATDEEAPGSKPAVPHDMLARYPSVVHPMVIEHPESGRKCLYISPTYLDRVLDVSDEESDEILSFIVDHTLKPEFIYRHVWAADDLVLWDNRRMMHAATGYPPKYRRFALRTTLAGSLKSGRLYDSSAVEAKAELVD